MLLRSMRLCHVSGKTPRELSQFSDSKDVTFGNPDSNELEGISISEGPLHYSGGSTLIHPVRRIELKPT